MTLFAQVLRPPPDEATRPDWATNTDRHDPLERYQEHVAATGLVPEARLATWDSEPWEPGRA